MSKVSHESFSQSLNIKPQKAPYLNVNNKIPATVNAAIFSTYKVNAQAIEDLCHYIENNLSDIILLPELFFVTDKSSLHDAEQLKKCEELGQQLISQVSAELRAFQYVCTSLIIDGAHQAVLINEHGIYAQQQQIHFCERLAWTLLSETLAIIELPLEQGHITLAMLTGDDANTNQIVSLAARENIHALLVPFDIQESCEVEDILIFSALKHKICVVAASKEKSFVKKALSINSSGINVSESVSHKNNTNNIFKKNKVKQHKSTGFIATFVNKSIQNDSLTFLKPEPLTNFNMQPSVKRQNGKITKALIHPTVGTNKA